MNCSSWLDDGGSFNYVFYCSCGCRRRVAIPDARCVYCAAEGKEPLYTTAIKAVFRFCPWGYITNTYDDPYCNSHRSHSEPEVEKPPEEPPKYHLDFPRRRF